MQLTWNFVLLCIIFGVIPILVGGWIAYRKNDFISRGVVISLFSSWYGPIFMYFSPPSRAREGDEEDMASWPTTGPFACLSFIATCLVVYLVVKYI